jgi:predicted nuclease of restriction endonuclease-like (RecB) superfamily
MTQTTLSSFPADYKNWLTQLKTRIQGTRQQVLLSANQTQIRLYHEIGLEILERQEQQGWEAKKIDQLTADHREAFPDMKGFSSRNLKYMMYFAKNCPNMQFVQQTVAQLPSPQIAQQTATQLPSPPIGQQPAAQLPNSLTGQQSVDQLPNSLIVQQSVAQLPDSLIGQQSVAQIGQQSVDQLPWAHIILLLTKISEPVEREWYARQAVQNGWSRSTLQANVKNGVYQRQGAAITNFAERLPAPHADIAIQILKDPYHFDFLGLGEEAHERDIENALIRHITRFLLELGAGFAFVGRQFRLEVGESEFFIDLLFYHTRLKCYVVVELKATEFKPEHAGQLNFYLSAVDAEIKASDDKPTIGLLLCKSKDRVVAEYALSGIDKPMGVAEYQLVRALPEPLDTCLPSIEEIEAALEGELGD